MKFCMMFLMIPLSICLYAFGLVHGEDRSNQIGFSPGYAILSHLEAENRPAFQAHFRQYISEKLGFEVSLLYMAKKRNGSTDSIEWSIPVHFQMIYTPTQHGHWPVSLLFGGGLFTSFRSHDELGNSNETSFEFVTGVCTDHHLNDHLVLQPRLTMALYPALAEDTQFLGYVVVQAGLAYEW